MSIWVDHFAIAVRSIDEAGAFFARYLPMRPVTPTLPGHTNDFRWRQYGLGHVKVELIEPAGSSGFVDRFLERRGEGLHHLTLHTDDLEPIERQLLADGVRLVDRWDDGSGERCVFLSPRSAFGMLIQLWQVKEGPPPPVPQDQRRAKMPGLDAQMVFNHLATAVTDIKEVEGFFARYFPVERSRGIHRGYAGDFDLTQFEIPGLSLELIADASGESFVSRFLARRGPGFHHLSIDVDRIDPIIERLREEGLRLVDEADIGNGYKTFFISPRSAHGVLIQFWQVPHLSSQR